MPNADSMIGELIVGRYRVTEKIGSGGGGTVYGAYDLNLERVVAIKFLGISGDPGLESRFVREAKATARIKHPNIVEVYEHGRAEDGTRFIVLERVRGIPLNEFQASAGEASAPVSDLARFKAFGVTDARVFSIGTTMELMRQICAGVSAVHKGRFVHRDVKPDNVLVGELDDRLTVKIIDLGVAKGPPPQQRTNDDTVLDINYQEEDGRRRTQVGQVFGTLPYMEPTHQLSGKPFDHSNGGFVDVYALGVLAYELLTGRYPYEDSPLIQACSQNDPHAEHAAWMGVHIQKHPLKPVTEIRPDLPRALNAFFDRALGHDASKHFQTVGEFLGALESAVRDTIPPPPLESAIVKPLPVLGIAVGFIALLLAVSVVLVLTHGSSRRGTGVSHIARSSSSPLVPLTVPAPPPAETLNALGNQPQDASPPNEETAADASLPPTDAHATTHARRSSRRSHRREIPCGRMRPDGTIQVCIR